MGSSGRETGKSSETEIWTSDEKGIGKSGDTETWNGDETEIWDNGETETGNMVTQKYRPAIK
jgi:hypothetical protein